MGYVGSWISGHSGTAQKNKKVFARRNHRSLGSTSADQREVGKIVGRYKLHHGGRDLSDLLMLFLVALLVGAAYWWAMGVTANDSSLQEASESQITMPVEAPQTAAPKLDGFTEEEKHAYNFLLGSGRKSMSRGEYRVAVYEFDQALEISPYSKQARLALFEAITKVCAAERYYCDRVEPQRTFLEEMGWLVEK